MRHGSSVVPTGVYGLMKPLETSRDRFMAIDLEVARWVTVDGKGTIEQQDLASTRILYLEFS
jgi:hypothetical protein